VGEAREPAEAEPADALPLRSTEPLESAGIDEETLTDDEIGTVVRADDDGRCAHVTIPE
jgi:hypothetical protein